MPTPGSGPPLKPGEFILGYPDESGRSIDLPEPEILSRNGSYMAYRRLQEHRDTAANINRRRMIRRGATYGLPLRDDAPDDGTDRGIAAFIICASLIRQFEFAQNVWTNDRNFHELGNERDPIIGAHDGTLEFKIPKRPIRKTITGLPAFTTVRGGACYYMLARTQFRLGDFETAHTNLQMLASLANDEEIMSLPRNKERWWFYGPNKKQIELRSDIEKRAYAQYLVALAEYLLGRGSDERLSDASAAERTPSARLLVIAELEELGTLKELRESQPDLEKKLSSLRSILAPRGQNPSPR